MHDDITKAIPNELRYSVECKLINRSTRVVPATLSKRR